MKIDPVLSQLLERCRNDHQEWINGNGAPYTLPEDGTILGAVGGFSAGGTQTSERQRQVAALWRRGRGSVEFLNGGVDGDVAWLALVERSVVEFAGEAEGVERRWDLRVTEIFRRRSGEWQRVHRHADPLVDRHPVEAVAALLG